MTALRFRSRCRPLLTRSMSSPVVVCAVVVPAVATHTVVARASLTQPSLARWLTSPLIKRSSLARSRSISAQSRPIGDGSLSCWRRRWSRRLVVTAAPPTYAATDFPSRPIVMVVPYPPGGPTDAVSRIVAAEMSKTIGQNVLVDNKPGASGMIGADMVARAAPDGYTFLANASLHVINPYLYKSMKHDAFRDFAPITQLADVPLVLVVPATSNIAHRPRTS